jgi:HEAT repeat protein
MRLSDAKPKLITLLHDRNDRVREAAIDALVSLGASECAPQFRDALRDPKLEERAGKAIVTLRLEVLTDDLIELLGDVNLGRRRLAASVLSGLRARKAIPTFITLLKREDENDVLMALEALTHLKASEAGPAVAALLGTRSPLIRRCAIEFLGETRTKGYEEAVLRCLEEKDESLRQAALRAAGILQIREAAPRVLELLKEESTAGSTAALSLRDPRTTERVLGLLKEMPKHNWTWLNMLGALGAKETTREVLPFLSDPDRETRRRAVKALEHFGASERLPEVKALARDQRPDVRASALDLLGRLGDGSYAAEALRGLRDENRWVRAAAVGALARLNPRSADLITSLLSDPEVMVRMSAAQALGRLGDTLAVPGLEASLKDPSIWVRLRAAEALCMLGRDSGVPWLLEFADTKSDASLATLNALKEPVTWRSLNQRSWGKKGWLDAEEAGELLQKELGLKVLCESDRRRLVRSTFGFTQFYYESYESFSPRAIDFVESIAALYVSEEWVLEGSLVRVMDHQEALTYWQEWWERRKRSRK